MAISPEATNQYNVCTLERRLALQIHPHTNHISNPYEKGRKERVEFQKTGKSKQKSEHRSEKHVYTEQPRERVTSSLTYGRAWLMLTHLTAQLPLLSLRSLTD